MNSTHRLVRPTHLNQFGYLFGGQLLAWVDEACWIAASIAFPECQFVTIAMNSVEFRHSVQEGDILRIDSKLKSTGRTSAQFRVEVFSQDHGENKSIFTTDIAFVNLDNEGNKQPIQVNQ